MFGVDKGDQIRLHGGGFARKAHFKKWYKKSFMAVLDCMLLNSLIAWNIAASDPDLKRIRMQRYEFYTWIAESLLHYKDRNVEPPTPEAVRDGKAEGILGDSTIHRPVATVGRQRCAVCKLECNIAKIGEGNLRKNIVGCSDCRIHAHNHILKNPLRIHTMTQFEGLTCFEIAHSEEGRCIWVQDESDNKKTVPYRVKYSHRVVQELRSSYGLNPKKTRSKSTIRNLEEDYDADNEETQTQHTYLSASSISTTNRILD